MGEHTYLGNREAGDGRLHSLLSLKRHEMPPTEAFDAFTAEFRRRREATERAVMHSRRPSLAARWSNLLAHVNRRWIYGLGLGYATAVVAFLMWLPGYEAQNVQPVRFEMQPMVYPVEEVAQPLTPEEEKGLQRFDTTPPVSEEKF